MLPLATIYYVFSYDRVSQSIWDLMETANRQGRAFTLSYIQSLQDQRFISLGEIIVSDLFPLEELIPIESNQLENYFFTDVSLNNAIDPAIAAAYRIKRPFYRFDNGIVIPSVSGSKYYEFGCFFQEQFNRDQRIWNAVGQFDYRHKPGNEAKPYVLMQKI